MQLAQVLFIIALVFGGSVPSVQAQEPSSSDPPVLQETINLVRRCKEGIEDPQARFVERKRWAETLFAIDSHEAKALTIDLLRLSATPDIPKVMCTVISEQARLTPARLNVELIAPLIDLLGVENQDIRRLAAQALADLPGSQVPSDLGALAGNKDASLVKRKAAVAALEPNTHRRDVVAQLMVLLDSDDPQIVERAKSAMEPVIPKSVGRHIADWKTWWAAESRLSEDAWQARQLQLHSDRWRLAEDQLQRKMREAQQKEKVLTAQLQKFQREIYRAVSPDQRDTKIVEWLRDPLAEVNQSAMAMIKARIADEGKRPEGEVLGALLALFEAGSAKSRRDALEICQNLSDPIVVEKILTRLAGEEDLATRRVIFEALGNLDSTQAVPVIVQEIANPQSDPGCVEKAAMALGRISSRADVKALVPDAVTVLANRYRSILDHQRSLRASLLNAMVGVADPSFVPVFQAAVEIDDARIVREAIRGLRVMKDASKRPRLRTLTTHADAFVRLEAIEALGQLGVEDADLEPLLARLRPTEEPNERARDAAWRGFLAFCARRSMEEQVAMSQRLREMPENEAKYLTVLADILATSSNAVASLESVRERLAAVLLTLNRHNDAVVPLQALWEGYCSQDDQRAFEVGLRLLLATLKSGGDSKAARTVQQLVDFAGGDSDQHRVIQMISEHFDSPELLGNAERAGSLHKALAAISPGPTPASWTQLLDRIDERVKVSKREANAGQPIPVP